jgi:hypothetical protein
MPHKLTETQFEHLRVVAGKLVHIVPDRFSEDFDDVLDGVMWSGEDPNVVYKTFSRRCSRDVIHCVRVYFGDAEIDTGRYVGLLCEAVSDAFKLARLDQGLRETMTDRHPGYLSRLFLDSMGVRLVSSLKALMKERIRAYDHDERIWHRKR